MSFFGFTLPSFSLPQIRLPSFSLPKVTLPKLPQITLPKITLPSFSLPKISLPKFTMPSITLPAGLKEGTKAAAQYIQEKQQQAVWAAQTAMENAMKAGSAVSSAVTSGVSSLPNLTKVNLPDLTKVNVPDIGKAVSSAVSSVSLPKLPNVPDLGKAVNNAVASVSLPKLPDLSGLQQAAVSAVAMPLTFGADTVTAIQAGKLPELPKLPDLSQSVFPGVSAESGDRNVIDTVIDARDKSYEDGLTRVFSGENVPGGAAQVGLTAATDVLLPLDLMNAGNLWATGRGNEITGEMMLYAGIDALTIGLGVATGGIGYGVGRAVLKGGKLAKAAGTAAKGTKLVAQGGDMLKLGTVANVARKVGTAVKKPTQFLSKVKKTTIVQPKVAVNQASIGRKVSKAPMKNAKTFMEAYRKAPLPVKQTKAGVSAMEAEKTAAKVYAPTKTAIKSEATIADLSTTSKALTAADTTKTTSKLSSLGTAAKYGVLGAGLGLLGATALGVGALPGYGEEPYNPYTDPESPYSDPYGFLPGDKSGSWWDTVFGDPEGLPGGGEYPPDGYPLPDDGGYYPPGYPGGDVVAPIEYVAQDVAGMMEGWPGIGGIIEEARRRGLALPLLICGVVVIGGGGYLLYKSKLGQKAVRKVKGVVS